MIRPFLVAAGLAMGLAAWAPAFAQPQKEAPAAPQSQSNLVGLPIYSSDGQKLGEVTQVGMSGDQVQAVRAEMGEFLGLGPSSVVIAANVFAQKPDRLELSMTAAEVKDRLSQQQQKK